MKPSFDPRPTSTIAETIARALRAAGLSTQHATHSSPVKSVTQTIRRALAAAGLTSVAAPNPPGGADGGVIDVKMREVPTPLDRAAPAPPTTATGTFVTHSFSNPAGTRAYKLYRPARAMPGRAPLIVMLHGCTQSPDDFAAGTQMNRLADEQGFFVVYPAQGASDNPSKCWNWFSARDQRRDRGEPSLIAGIAREVASQHAVDPQRIFVAGLSAGAAMAVIVGETYPELFAGVGVHSGLPYAAASDLGSALAAMKGGKGLAASIAQQPAALAHAVPTIVFHGDRDHTVQAVNGEQIAEQARAAHVAAGAAGGASQDGLVTQLETGRTAQGRRFSRNVQADRQGRAVVEAWLLHGAGHAWSGGDPSGSYTDATGPNASAEMVRFFFSQPVRAAV